AARGSGIRVLAGVIPTTHDDDRSAVAKDTPGGDRRRPGLSDAAHPRAAPRVIGLLVGAAGFPFELWTCRVSDIERVDRPAAAAHRRIDPDTGVVRGLIDADRTVEVIVLGRRRRGESR